MYTNYFGLDDNPFSIAPNPRYLFLSPRYAEALAHLEYGLSESGGFVLLTGEVGTGKTTLVRSLLQRVPEHVDAALVLYPRLDRIEFLQAICEELGVDHADDWGSKRIMDAIGRHLLAAHGRGQHRRPHADGRGRARAIRGAGQHDRSRGADPHDVGLDGRCR
jgi:general secretion pathway protein A